MWIITKVDAYVDAEPQRIKRNEIFIFTFNASRKGKKGLSYNWFTS